MSEQFFVPPGFEDDPSIFYPSPESSPETETTFLETPAVEQFFGKGLFDEQAYVKKHPLGEDARSPEDRAPKIALAQGLLSRMQSTPGFKWLIRGLLGMSLALSSGEVRSNDAQASMSKEQTPQAETMDPEQAAQDAGVQYELRRLVLEDLQAEGRVFSELDARMGPDDLTPEEAREYGERVHDLGAKFEFLHRNDPEILKAYHEPRTRLENYDTLAALIGKEFIHSKLLWTFTDETADIAVELLSNLPEQEGKALYLQVYTQMTKHVGIRTPFEMSQRLLEVLDADHPLVQTIRDQKLADPSMASWFKKSPQNNAYFDQATGRLEIMRRLSPKERTAAQGALTLADTDHDLILLLDSAPANGGDPTAPSFYDSESAQQEVRTPDGEFPYLETVRKKSPSWQTSWIADGSPLRMSADGENVEYQDVDGKWYRATGEHAVFFGSERPFEKKNGSWIVKAGTRVENGEIIHPRPLNVKDFFITNEKGESVLAERWERNDFGPLAIHVKDPKKGGRASFMYHSSPKDESPWSFLVYSHGCVHMKPEDIQLLDGYLARGSLIRNSSVHFRVDFEPETIVANL